MKKENKIRTLTIIIMLALAAILLSCGKTTKTTDAVTAPVYTQVDEMPIFPHGDSALMDFITKNAKYPEEAKRTNIEGCVVVRFIVEKDCRVSNPMILKHLNPLLDDEAIRVINMLPNFERPAKLNGEPVSVYYMIPITFDLK